MTATDIKVLIDNDGFIVVLKSDASALVEQVEINRSDFLDWMAREGRSLAAETLTEIDRQARRNTEPQIFLYYVPKTGRGRPNLELALENGVWGFPESEQGVTRKLATISDVKQGDIVVAIHSFSAAPEVKARGGRLPSAQYVGRYERIIGLVATSKLYRDDKNAIWPDQQYPHRFSFRTPPLFLGHNIPCSPKALGPALHEVMRRLQVNGAMQKIDGSSMTKLMSLCTE